MKLKLREINKLAIFIMFFLVIFSFSGFSNIISTNADIEILNERTTFETLTFNFNQSESGKISYSIPLDSTKITIEDEKNKLYFYTEDTSTSKKIIVKMSNSTQLKISFYTNNLIFKNRNIYQFFTTFYPENHKLDYIKVNLKLPEGYMIYNNQTSPNAKLYTDGKHIIVMWIFKNVSEPVSIYIKFYSNNSKKTFIISIFIILIIAFILLFNYLKKSYRKKLLNAFDEDEKKVIELISSKRILYQNKIEKRLNFSRAKMTRIIKKLEKKKLIKKEKRGRTNKLFWIGKL